MRQGGKCHQMWAYRESGDPVYGFIVVIVTRFAPSPSGPLHLGHAYSAAIAHDLARQRDGRFHLRIDDIDGTRSRSQFVDAAIADLDWLGLDWDAPAWRQSDHIDGYDAALARLRTQDLVYPCFCTRADIVASLTAPHGPAGNAYPGTCRHLSAGEGAERMACNAFCWRVDMDRATHLAGPLVARCNGTMVRLDARGHGDVVLGRKDAPASYHLASTVDDAALGVNLVVRGADLEPATAVHVLLQRLLELPTPDYHHHALVCGSDGQRLAKRDRPATLSALRDAGIDGKELADALRVGKLPAGYSLAEA
jgi:glutamyl-Q tRNA(Asp) synthetase